MPAGSESTVPGARPARLAADVSGASPVEAPVAGQKPSQTGGDDRLRVVVEELTPGLLPEFVDRLAGGGTGRTLLGGGLRGPEIDLERQRPGSVFIAASAGGRLVGAAATGWLGLCGIVRSLWYDAAAPVEGIAWRLCRAAMHEFEAAGLPRAQVRFETVNAWEGEVWQAYGFSRPAGSQLWTCHVKHTQESHRPASGVTVVPLQKVDARAVGAVLRQAPESGFEAGDQRALEMAPLGRNRSFFIAQQGGELAGVLFGGCFGDQAGISHLWVRDAQRARGVGQCLMAQAVLAFGQAEARHIHVLLNARQLSQARFWQGLGFRENRTLNAMERQLGGASQPVPPS